PAWEMSLVVLQQRTSHEIAVDQARAAAAVAAHRTNSHAAPRSRRRSLPFPTRRQVSIVDTHEPGHDQVRLDRVNQSDMTAYSNSGSRFSKRPATAPNACAIC